MGVEPAKNRLKFICSYGGKILPRATDGQLKYVGGDTRVFAFTRSVSFSELKKRLTSAYDAELAIKYHLMPEDLDTLVSVKNDEDIQHMVDEYDHQDSANGGGGSPRFRVFLFPTKASSTVHVPARKPSSSSPGSSPTSTTTADSAGLEFASATTSSRMRHPMHKAHSSPSLCGMAQQAAAGPLGHSHSQRYHQQHSRIPRPRQCPGGVSGMWRTGSPPSGMYEMSPVGSPRCLPRRRYFGPLTYNGSRKGSPRGPHGSYFRRQEEFCSCCSRRPL